MDRMDSGTYPELPKHRGDIDDPSAVGGQQQWQECSGDLLRAVVVYPHAFLPSIASLPEAPFQQQLQPLVHVHATKLSGALKKTKPKTSMHAFL